MFKLNRNIEIENEVKNITIENLNNSYWLDKDTYITDIEMTNNLRTVLKELIEDDEVIFYAEYWADENKYRYILQFEDDSLLINDLVECKYLNQLILNKINS